MTKYEQLQENLEDAIFSLLMYELDQPEGEDQPVKDDTADTVAVPEDFDARCRKTMQREFARRKRKSAAKVIGKVFNIVATIVLIVSALAVSAFAAFPSVRAEMLEVLIEISDVSTRLSVVDRNSPTDPITDDIFAQESPKVFLGYSMPVLAKDLLLEDMTLMEDGLSGRIRYYNSDTAQMVNINISAGKSINVDSENADRVEQISINGFDGLLIEKANRVNVVWIDLENIRVININCYNMNSSDVLKIAEEIRFCGEQDA